MDCPEITIRNGKVKGYISILKCRDAKPVYIYRSIPYAKPPIGSLRFMPPQPAAPWTGILDCTKDGPSAMQSSEDIIGKQLDRCLPTPKIVTETSEDCLHLTVNTPEPNAGKKLPVMVWIHGGAFQVGSEIVYDCSALAGMNDVVTVAMNYRINVFGFLSLGKSSICPGNAGLLDQVLALKWVQDNIESFGGDKDNVTIFGESAGGISVNHHVNSPLSKGLFHKAISQSGQSALPKFISTEECERSLDALLQHFKIKEKDDKILQALQEIPASDLVASLDILAAKNCAFHPLVDGNFIPKAPVEILKDGEPANEVPYMIGVNNSEGLGIIAMAFCLGFIEGWSEEETKKALSQVFHVKQYDDWKARYMQDETDKMCYGKLYGDIFQNVFMAVPAVRAASVYSDAGMDIYLYHGAFQLRLSHDDKYGPNVGKKSDLCFCDHADDVIMFLGFPFYPGEPRLGEKFSEEEIALSRKCMAYITNFAKNGDPNKGAKVDLHWPKYKPRGQHMVLDHQLKIGTDIAGEEVEYWSKQQQAN